MTAETKSRVTLYSHLWPFYGGRQWHSVELLDHFGWSVVSYYEDHKGFAVQSSHQSKDEALEELNKQFNKWSTQHTDGLRVEETEQAEEEITRREFACVGIYHTTSDFGSGRPLIYLYAMSDLGGRQIVGCLDTMPSESGTYLTEIPSTREPVAVVIDLEKITVV